MISWAASAIACKPDEQKRFTVSAGHRHRQPGADRRDARDVVPLRALGEAAAEDDVLDLGRIELRHFPQHVGDAVCGQVVGPGQVERTAKRLRQRRPRTGDDNGLAHNLLRSSILRIEREAARLGESSYGRL